MRHLLCAILTVIGSVLPAPAEEAPPSASSPRQFERPSLKEPTYQSTPKYCLMLLSSARGDVNVWMVEDGKRLFVDKNANGDLTDDGPPIEPSDVRDLGQGQSDFNYKLEAITAANGSRHTRFDLRRWNYGKTEDKSDTYGLSLALDGHLHLYAGWFGTFWSAKRETAPVIHFGGAFRPAMLRAQVFEIGSGPQRLSLGFMAAGSHEDAESRLSIEAFPNTWVPKTTIEWPVAAGSPPLRTSHALVERCCYWEFYLSTFEVPKGTVPGKAKLTVELPAATPIVLTTTELEVRVTKPSANQKSSR